VRTTETPWPPIGDSPFLAHWLFLPLLVGTIQIAGTHFAGLRQPDRIDLDALGILLLAVGPAALVLRWHYPVAVLSVVLAATLSYLLLDYPRGPIFLALIVAFVTAVLAGHRIAAVISLLVGYPSFAWLPYLVGTEPPPTLAQALGVGAWLLVLLTSAEIARSHRDNRLVVERKREEEAKHRASKERLRIARELHDILAHNVAVISVQAGVALHLIDERPEQVRSALAVIKQASNDALHELRSVLDLLRNGDPELSPFPAAGLNRLNDLVSKSEGAGLVVTAHTLGTPRTLPSAVDLAAFRIVQEALTNATRYARGARVTIEVTYGDHDLIITIEDDGAGVPASTTAGSGQGVAGMRERAALLGGDFEAGPRAGGGFRVSARLPLGTNPASDPANGRLS
jgi:signal transduction histidine kinase